MLSLELQRRCRNRYYRLIATDSPWFTLFRLMFQQNSALFSGIYPCQNDVFMATSFLSPALKKYSGREIAAFNARLVACYWLPGVQSQAQGILPATGDYFLALRLLDAKNMTYCHLEKSDEYDTRLIEMSNDSPETPSTFIPCNLLKYALFETELICHINAWMGAFEQYLGADVDQEMIMNPILTHPATRDVALRLRGILNKERL